MGTAMHYGCSALGKMVGRKARLEMAICGQALPDEMLLVYDGYSRLGSICSAVSEAVS